MTTFLTVFACLVILSFVYAFYSMVASAGNRLLGSSGQSKSSRLDSKQQDVQELLQWANELEQQARQLQQDQAEWMQEPAKLEQQYQQIKSKQLPG